MKQFYKLSAIGLSMFTLVLSAPVSAMLKHRFDPERHRQVKDAAAQKTSSRKGIDTPKEKKQEELLTRMESFEDRLHSLEFQLSLTLIRERRIISGEKQGQRLNNQSTFPILRRKFSFKKKGREALPTIPESPILSAPPTPPNVPSSKKNHRRATE